MSSRHASQHCQLPCAFLRCSNLSGQGKHCSSMSRKGLMCLRPTLAKHSESRVDVPIREAVKPLKKALYEPSLNRAVDAPLIPRMLGSTAILNLRVSKGYVTCVQVMSLSNSDQETALTPSKHVFHTYLPRCSAMYTHSCIQGMTGTSIRAHAMSTAAALSSITHQVPIKSVLLQLPTYNVHGQHGSCVVVACTGSMYTCGVQAYQSCYHACKPAGS